MFGGTYVSRPTTYTSNPSFSQKGLHGIHHDFSSAPTCRRGETPRRSRLNQDFRKACAEADPAKAGSETHTKNAERGIRLPRPLELIKPFPVFGTIVVRATHIERSVH